MDNAMTIAKYCEKNLSSKKEFPSYVRNNYSFLFSLLKNELLPANVLQHINKRLLAQRVYNKFFYEEIQSLSKLPYRLIGFKGFFIQAKYYPQEYTRLCGDIDVLVSTKNSYRVYKSILRMNYSLSEYKLQTIIFRHIFISFLQHLSFTKRVHERINVAVELHVNLNVKCRVRFALSKMIKNAVLCDYGNFKFYVFEPTDNLLYLMFHPISHLCYVRHGSNEITINLQSIYDVAQVIDNEIVNWDLFCERAIQYKLTPYISLYIHIFNDIFPDKIPTITVEKLRATAVMNKFHWEKAYSFAINKLASQIIVGDFDDTPAIRDIYAQISKHDRREWKKTRKAWKSIEKTKT